MACSSPPEVVEPVRLSAAEGLNWVFVDGEWLVEGAPVAVESVAARFPLDRRSIVVVMPAEEPANTVAPVLIAALENGVERFDLGQVADTQRWPVFPPPAVHASRSFAVVSVRAEGVTVAAPGGAEVAVPCGACTEVSDWRFDGVTDALAEAAVDEVLIAFSPTVPWGVVLAGVDIAGERHVRIARGE